MTFAELHDEIKADIPDAKVQQILRAANRVIKQINRRVTGIFTLETAYTSGSAASGYTWDSTNFELTLHTDIKQLLRVYVLKQEFSPIDYNYLRNITSGYSYAFKDRDTIVFPYDVVDAATDIMYLEIYKKILDFADTTRTTSITVPTQIETVIFDGVLSYLYAMPSYKDKDMYEVVKSDYERGLDELDTLEHFRFPPANIAMEYEY